MNNLRLGGVLFLIYVKKKSQRGKTLINELFRET